MDGAELVPAILEKSEVENRSKSKDSIKADAEGVLARIRALEGADSAPLDLKPVTHTSSYSVRDNMSILRAYSLFRTMGSRHMIVVDIGNRVVGMLARNDLVDVCHPHHDEHHDAPAPAAPAAGTGREALLPR